MAGDNAISDAPDTIEGILTRALRRHGTLRVASALGVSRLAVLSIALGLSGHASTRFQVRARLERLRELDEAPSTAGASR